jgi:hypothetical protein
MEQWRRRVNEALDALLAAQIAESSLRRQLEAAQRHEAAQREADLMRLLRETSEAAKAARMQVEAVLWE